MTTNPNLLPEGSGVGISIFVPDGNLTSKLCLTKRSN